MKRYLLVIALLICSIGLDRWTKLLAIEHLKDEPMRDIKTFKAMERYGCGILAEGKAIAVAKNISFAKSYDLPERVWQVTPQV